jgi:hypothetical protein
MEHARIVNWTACLLIIVLILQKLSSVLTTHAWPIELSAQEESPVVMDRVSVKMDNAERIAD